MKNKRLQSLIDFPLRGLLRGLVTSPVGDSGAVSFSPLSLFSSGEKGFWIDPSDLTTLFQDDGATVPVTTTADPVGAVVDKVTEATFFTQANATKKPAYILDSGIHSLRFTPAQSDILVSSAIDLTAATTITVIAGFLQNNDTGFQTIMQQGDGSITGASGSEISIWLNNGGNGSYGGGIGKADNYSLFKDLTNVAVPRSYVVTNTFTPTDSQKSTLREGGLLKEFTTAGSAGTVSDGFTNATFQLGGAGTTGSYDGDCFGMIVIDRDLTAEETANAEAWMADKSGVGLGQSYVPPTVSDTKTPIDRTAYLETSPFTQAVFDTDATNLQLVAFNNIWSTIPSWSRMGLYIDNVFNSIIPSVGGGMGQDGEVTTYMTLPAGAKRVSVVTGLQSKPTSTVLGSFINSIAFNAPATPVTIPDTDRLLVYGDSIAVGSSATTIMEEAWVLQVRSALSDSVALEGWGFRSLNDDAVDGTARAAFVDIILQYNPSSFWLAIGTNDYGIGGGLWSAADFGTAYGALLDDLNTALPSLTIFAQTPIVRTDESANANFSDTLGDYRSAIATAVSTRTGFTTLVDGTAFLTTGDLADGVHPTSTGHDLYAAAVLAELGP